MYWSFIFPETTAQPPSHVNSSTPPKDPPVALVAAEFRDSCEQSPSGLGFGAGGSLDEAGAADEEDPESLEPPQPARVSPATTRAPTGSTRERITREECVMAVTLGPASVDATLWLWDPAA